MKLNLLFESQAGENISVNARKVVELRKLLDEDVFLYFNDVLIRIRDNDTAESVSSRYYSISIDEI